MAQPRSPPAGSLQLTQPLFPHFSSRQSATTAGPLTDTSPEDLGRTSPPSCPSANCPSSSSGTGRFGLPGTAQTRGSTAGEFVMENPDHIFSTLTRTSFAPSPPACPFLPPSQAGRKLGRVIFFPLARCFSCFCCSKTHRSGPGSRLQILSCAANDQHLPPRLIKEVGRDTASKKAEIPFFNCFGTRSKTFISRISERRKR